MPIYTGAACAREGSELSCTAFGRGRTQIAASTWTHTLKDDGIWVGFAIDGKSASMNWQGVRQVKDCH
jgi:hypothetical protein